MVVIQFLLSTTLSRVCRISIGGDSSSGIFLDFENSIMVELEDVDAIVAAIQGEDVDPYLHVHVIVLIVVKIIIHHICVRISLINLN